MGIPGLTKDLLPYAEHAVLGKRLDGVEGEISLTSIVIDGPSFVYFVQHLISKSLARGDRTILSYDEINAGVIDLLNDLTSHGIDIQRIFFDGALPVFKRGTRLDRLEQQRRHLEAFWKFHTAAALASRRVDQETTDRSSFGERPAQLSPSASAGLQLVPPFMVPSAIEHLSQSIYAPLVRVVPEEADTSCVIHANLTGAAILSNDSDLALYDLCRNSVLICLQSLHKVDVQNDPSKYVASCLRPQYIAERLQVTSLRAFAFERSLDLSASFSIIKQRARNPTRVAENSARYDVFAAQYDAETERPLKSATWDSALDPRLSELFCQYLGPQHSIAVDESLQMYLSILQEDPSGDASWSYGQNIRQLAYSMVNLSMPRNLRRTSLIEFHRRGSRITGNNIPLLDMESAQAALSSTSDLVKTNMKDAASPFSWHLLAVYLIGQHKHAQKKANIPRDAALRVLGLERINSDFSQGDIHLRANMQALLYSFRLLKQAIDRVSAKVELKEALQLTNILDKLPALPALMDYPVTDSACLSKPQVSEAYLQLSRTLNEYPNDQVDVKDVPEGQPPKKRKKSKNIPGYENHSKQQAQRNGNIFDLLRLD